MASPTVRSGPGSSQTVIGPLTADPPAAASPQGHRTPAQSPQPAGIRRQRVTEGIEQVHTGFRSRPVLRRLRLQLRLLKTKFCYKFLKC